MKKIIGILRVVMHLSLMCVLTGSTGCSSLGFSLWPSQFPLLNQTKEFAARSPLPSGLAHELAKNVLPEYYIEPGDRLLIEPIALDSNFRVIGDQEVKVDGSIDLGEYGRMRVAGMTVEAIESAIEERIAQLSAASEAINVQLVETNAAKVYVLGEVGSPGGYVIDGNETVLDAIVMAGGVTSKASPCDMILVRPTRHCDNRVVLRVCYRQITQLGDVTTNYQLQPGDRIVVGSRTLGEELAFWRQTNPCECCNRSRGVECKPSMVNYSNRFSNWLTQFPLPRKFPDEPLTEDISDSGSPGERGTLREPVQDRSSRRSLPRSNVDDDRAADDSDIFLPPHAPLE